MRPILIVLALLLVPGVAVAEHLKPRLFILPPKEPIQQGFDVRVERLGIVNRVNPDSIQVVGLFLFGPAPVAMTCNGDFTETGAFPLMHGDIVRFVSANAGCVEFEIVSCDPAESQALEDRWFAAVAPPAAPAAEAEPKAEAEAAGPSDELVYTDAPDLPQEVPDVASVQRGLAALGYDPGPPDNVFGRRTGAAIAAFRAQHPALRDAEDRTVTLELWQNLALARRGLDRPVRLPDGTTKTAIAAFWITRRPDGEFYVVGGGRQGFSLVDVRFNQRLAEIAGRIDTGQTVLMKITSDRAGYLVEDDG